MTMLRSQHSILRRTALLGGMLMLLFPVGSSGALAASPSPAASAPAAKPSPAATAAAAKPSPTPAAPAAHPSASPRSPASPSPITTPKVIAPPALKKVGPRVLGPQAVASAAMAPPNCLLTCTLYAKEGTIALPGKTVPIWGFTSGPTGLTDAATLPGPTLITTAGQPLSITLCNMLPAADGNVALELPAASVTPDLTGVPGANSPGSCLSTSSNNRTYPLNGLAPGTYLYEAGATPEGPRQVAMVLSGILIVRPSDYLTSQSAYGASSPRPGPFTAEATVLVSEIDSEFNASPLTKDLFEYKPNYFLLNGHSFDPTNPVSQAAGKIDVIAGDQLLLHQADLGLRDHEMGILGARQSIQATDSHRLTNPVNVATNFLSSGQVADSFVQVDPGLGRGSQLPLYDSGLHLHNDANPGLGGMLTYLDVIAGVGGLPGGPITTDVTVSPRTNDGSQAETVTGTITAQGAGVITAAEWFLDDVGATRTVTDMVTKATSTITSATALFTAADVGAIIAGTDIPANTTITSVTNATTVTISQNASGSHPAGTLNIFIPATRGGSGHGHPINVPGNPSTAPVSFAISPADLLAAIAQAGGTPDSDHIIWVHGKDSANWGEVSGDTFSLNISGPLVYAITLHPDRTNGLPLPSGPANDQDGTADAVILATAQAALDGWVVDGAEYRIDGGAPAPLCTTPPPLTPMAGANCPAAAVGTAPPGGASIVAVAGSIPQAVLHALADGVHTVSVRAHELPPTGSCANPARCYSSWTLAGAQATLAIDTQGPVTSNMSVEPNPNNGSQSGPGNLGFLDAVRVTATLSDATTGNSDIALAEAFLGDNIPPKTAYGTGAEMIPSTAKWAGVSLVAYAYIPLQEIKAHPEGLVKIWVHGKDSAGNWGAPSAVQLILDETAPVITATTPGGRTGAATVNVIANDPIHGGVNSNIVAAEWWVGADPGFGTGTAYKVPLPGTAVNLTFPVNGRVHGATVSLRVQDAAGNWSSTSNQVIP